MTTTTTRTMTTTTMKSSLRLSHVITVGHQPVAQPALKPLPELVKVILGTQLGARFRPALDWLVASAVELREVGWDFATRPKRALRTPRPDCGQTYSSRLTPHASRAMRLSEWLM